MTAELPDGEPFEPDPPPAFTAPTFSAPADPLRCSVCGHRFGRRATCFVIDGGGGAALCRGCADSITVHGALFLHCSHRHAARAHCAAVTRGSALRLQRDGPR